MKIINILKQLVTIEEKIQVLSGEATPKEIGELMQKQIEGLQFLAKRYGCKLVKLEVKNEKD